MSDRSPSRVSVRNCIRQFLEHYDDFNKPRQGASYFSEEDAHYRVIDHIRGKVPVGWIHSEADLGRLERSKRSQRADLAVVSPKRYGKWYENTIREMGDGSKARFLKPPPYEALIEVKMIWRGIVNAPSKDGDREKETKKDQMWKWGGYSKRKQDKARVANDLMKLALCLKLSKTKEAHLILLDSLLGGKPAKNRNEPWYTYNDIDQLFMWALKRIKLSDYKKSKLLLWHWPDSKSHVGYYRVIGSSHLPRFSRA